MIKRLVGTVVPILAATALLTASPASAAGTGWSSCDRGLCDYAYVEGAIGTITDDSDDGIGAALDLYLSSGEHTGIFMIAMGPKAKTFKYPIKQARICNWNGSLSSCGAWKYFQ
ncbi:hypothetical protein ACFVHI_24115 [Kitasatospora sp. NPDC127121]|uniref:hypothetical protein n=1 Tax=unclassified Kitasatospora TaxID=2633591 RepID=UPI00362908FA